MSDVDKSSLNTLLKGRNALVVEDEVIISFLIQDLLEEQGGGGAPSGTLATLPTPW